MNGFAACEGLAGQGAAVPNLISSALAEPPGNGTCSENAENGASASFEDLLGQETSAAESTRETEDSSEGAEPKPAETPTTVFVSACPFFSPPPQVLLAQASPPPAAASDSGGATPAARPPEPVAGRPADCSPRAAEPALPKLPNSPAEPVPAQKPENILPQEVEASDRGPEQIAAKLRISASQPDGMAGAKQPLMVFTNSSLEQTSAAQTKALPEGMKYLEAPQFAEDLTLPAKALARSAAALPNSSEMAAAFGDLSHSAGPARLDHESPLLEVDLVVDPQRTVARTVEGIAGHVQLLRTSDQNRLEVVLKPDPGLAIHLEVTRTDGQIQVQARCERGHFAGLDAQWASIQNALAAQGIRVEPLQSTAPSSFSAGSSLGGDFGQQQRSQQQDRSDRPQPFVFEQDMPYPAPTSHGQPKSWPRGWQRWA